MSIAGPTALIRRAVSVPVGLIDRIDSGLDHAMAFVDSRIDSGVESVSTASKSFALAASRGVSRTDCVIERRYEAVDAKVQARIDSARRHGRHSAKYLEAVSETVDYGIARRVETAERIADAGVAALVATGQATVRATNALETNFDNKFATADAIFQRGLDKAEARATATANFAHATVERIDARITTDHARADRVTDIGINGVVTAAHATAAFISAVGEGTDGALASGVARADARIENRIAKTTATAQATAAFVSAKAATTERAMDATLVALDNRIEATVTSAQNAQAAFVAGVDATDQGLTKTAAYVDSRVDRRISQGAYAYAATTNFVMAKSSQVDHTLDRRVAAIDARFESGFAGLVRAAQGIAYFASDRIEDFDGSLTGGMNAIDRRIDAFVVESNGGTPQHAGHRASAAPPWVATTLTLVLGTLGAATGASAINADKGPVVIDNSVAIEASSAHQAVQQYMSVRDSFTAAQASRSRQIADLEADIAAAQQRATQDSLSGEAIIEVADDFGGVPYVRGGTTPKGFDCSGYTSYVFKQLGVKLPRTSAAQEAWADKVPASDRQVGDLMFWRGSGGVYHVGIYAGDGKMWDSPYPGRRVGKIGIWGNPTYGRPPAHAVNGAAVEEIAAKTAALQEIQANAPTLDIQVGQ